MYSLSPQEAARLLNLPEPLIDSENEERAGFEHWSGASKLPWNMDYQAWRTETEKEWNERRSNATRNRY